MTDFRIEQAVSITEAVVAKNLLPYTNILITEDNICVILANKTLLYEVQLVNITEPYPCISFAYKNIIVNEDGTHSIISDEIIAKQYIRSIYQNYKSIVMNYPCIAADNDLRSNEEFEKLLSLKSGNGLKFFNMIGVDNKIYMIPMFSGFLNLNKQDKIGIKVYDCGDHLVLSFNIYRKKINRNVNMFVRLLNI